MLLVWVIVWFRVQFGEHGKFAQDGKYCHIAGETMLLLINSIKEMFETRIYTQPVQLYLRGNASRSLIPSNFVSLSSYNDDNMDRSMQTKKQDR